MTTSYKFLAHERVVLASKCIAYVIYQYFLRFCILYVVTLYHRFGSKDVVLFLDLLCVTVMMLLWTIRPTVAFFHSCGSSRQKLHAGVGQHLPWLISVALCVLRKILSAEDVICVRRLHLRLQNRLNTHY